MTPPWDRMLWGVELTSSDGARILLGACWHEVYTLPYPDAPPMALLFATRAAARKWCAKQTVSYAGRTDGCGKWRFRPVRVRETVSVTR